MYIATIPNRGSPPAILLREGYREDGKAKNRTLANLSHLPPQRIEALRRALRGDFDGFDPNVTSDRIFGTLFVLNKVALRLGLGRALGKGRLAHLFLFLVLARIAHRGSRLSAVRWAADHAVAEVLGLDEFDEDALYEALSYGATHQRQIEELLFKEYVTRCGGQPALVLYDVTSSYLEGDKNELAAFGYDRDGKRGKKQIVIGLLAGADGEPLSVTVFDGNTSDPSTVAEQVRRLKERFGVEEVIFVGDRGMVKSKGKEAIGAAGLRYITALTDPQIRKLIRASVLQPELFDDVVCEIEIDSKRLVLRRNPRVATKEAHRREDKLSKLQTKVAERNAEVSAKKLARPSSGLARLTAWIASHGLNKFVTLHLDGRELHIRIDETAKTDDGLLDGCYVLETDVPRAVMDAATVDARYRDLAKVERDFRMMKTTLLNIRPLYVRTEEHTRGAVLVAMLALKMARQIETNLQQCFGTTGENANAVTIEEALTALGRLCLQRFEINGHASLRLPTPDARQKAILDALGVKYPSGNPAC